MMSHVGFRRSYDMPSEEIFAGAIYTAASLFVELIYAYRYARHHCRYDFSDRMMIRQHGKSTRNTA